MQRELLDKMEPFARAHARQLGLDFGANEERSQVLPNCFNPITGEESKADYLMHFVNPPESGRGKFG